MLVWALIFFIIALIAGILNFSGHPFLSPVITQISFYLSFILSLITLAVGIARKPPKI